MNDIIARLNWLPGWVVGIGLLVFAALVAISLHGLVLRAISALLPNEYQFGHRLLAKTKAPIRWALINIAVAISLPFAPFDWSVKAMIGKLLTASFICLVGLVAIKALDLAVALHLRRYRIDVEDNLLARKHLTQANILRRALVFVLVVVTAAIALMTFESVRQYGVSLLAAGGAAGVIVGLAAQPVLSNLFAGLQLAVTQPIRIDDAVIVEGEWGTIEEITATYVVVKVWDWRRLIVPLRYFIEQPFQNWTRENASLIGVVMLYLDYQAPLGRIREKLTEIAQASPLWDKRVINLAVVETTERTMQVRVLVSARNAPTAFDLRCEVREKLIAFLQEEAPEALPRQRNDITLPARQRQTSVLVADKTAETQPEQRWAAE
ncbi:mechanosensitive ion channel [Tianweitania sp. BSSL-BM11]|uniref:Mechanosensitive ion channel n=1 Tax=Tianweitania aestuarii TaxID=2814886 RepID=A0ABS5RV55_9HYPH|nr:mechanosensitive ion channel domain-containing protein [Tianweitania aestuarii]MBS9720650.1 mechanosensitive ion channel [Tianweitania aestuarii]